VVANELVELAWADEGENMSDEMLDGKPFDLPEPGGAAAAVASFLAAVLTEIYLCNVCSSDQDTLRRHGRG
jgi:hypothetical protein